MKRSAWIAVGFAVLTLALIAVMGARMTARAEQAAPAKAYGYLGVAECKACHNAEAKGAQYAKWEASPHAHAYKSLLTEASKKIVADKGIAGPPEKAAECLKCHVTGHGVKAELMGAKYTVEEGVGCESCHGPASEWKKLHVKDVPGAMAAGMMLPTDEKMCRTCHNEESPTFKGFEYAKALAAIAHPNPKKAAK